MQGMYKNRKGRPFLQSIPNVLSYKWPIFIKFLLYIDFVKLDPRSKEILTRNYHYNLVALREAKVLKDNDFLVSQLKCFRF